MTDLAAKWVPKFYATLQDDRVAADDLRSATQSSDMARWTACLTGVVVRSFEALGYAAAAKGFRSAALPMKRQEYLGQDIMVFARGESAWRFPVAVCELENAADTRVAYSLWKVLCIRCNLRVVFCYRPEADAGSPLVAQLAAEVVDVIPVRERVDLEGDTLIVMGSRNDAITFPYGFFHTWKLNLNTGRFERFVRQ